MTYPDPARSGGGRALIVSVLVAMLLLLAGCTLSSGGSDASMTADSMRAELDARLIEAWHAQMQALDLWTRIIDGEPVSCQDAIPAPEPVRLSQRVLAAHPQAEPVLITLNSAIDGLAMAARLWDAECTQSRPYVPLAVARDGRAAALAAGDALQRAAEQLAAW